MIMVFLNRLEPAVQSLGAGQVPRKEPEWQFQVEEQDQTARRIRF